MITPRLSQWNSPHDSGDLDFEIPFRVREGHSPLEVRIIRVEGLGCVRGRGSSIEGLGTSG